MKYHILITDGLAPFGIELLEKEPKFQIQVRKKTAPSQLQHALLNKHAVIVRSPTQLTEYVLKNTPHLKLIVRAGIGLDNIHLTCATEQGICVTNTAQANANATAELTIGLLFSLARNIPQACHQLKHQHLWERKTWKGIELQKKTLGIVGLGNVGSLVAQKALALGMHVLGLDPYLHTLPKTLKLNEGSFQRISSLESLLAQSDFVTLHTPLTDQTRGFFNKNKFQMMKKGSYFLNLARGALVEEIALLEALETHLQAAALDVYTQEPPPMDSALLAHPRVMVLPHIGAQTEEAQVRIAQEAAQHVIRFFLEKNTQFVLNPSALNKNKKKETTL